uniref:CSON003223 protein n=1 Tax=Culicoides sonorensis TaxID=179676 RepID=A0A336LXD5_CULSO
MSKQERIDLVSAFQIPHDYNPPRTYEEQQKSTYYPNFNTAEYRQKPVEIEVKLLPFFQCITRNSEGTIVLGTNDYSGRIWNGTMFAYDDIDEESPNLYEKEVAFSSYVDSSVTDLKFVDDSTILLSESDGGMSICSTRSVMRQSKNQSKYCLFIIGTKKEHKTAINCVDVFEKAKQKAVSADSDGCVKIWDLTNSDLVATNTLGFAHTEMINDISTSLENVDCFVTASNDKSLLLWDLRHPRPASALLEPHPYQIKAVKHLNENQLLVGDKAGIVSLVDKKMPNKIIIDKEIHSRSLHKFFIQGSNVITITDSKRLQVYKMEQNDMVNILDITEAPNFLRSATWINDSEFYVIGWCEFMKKYAIQ